jgi:hypothetical protein
MAIVQWLRRQTDRALPLVAGRRGFELIPRHYYSPIPYDTPRSAWDRVHPMPGVRFDVESQAGWVERAAANAEGWTPPESPMYGPVDAEVLYGMISELRPGKVVELGSGHSSEIIRQALGKAHEIYDPWPNERTDREVHRVSAADVPLDVFTELEAGDVLFVDTTHTVKTGGDVNRIILEVLPSLHPGVVVHIHDIFLPFEYPYEWAMAKRLWAEQYLLHAFLIANPEWEVLCGCHAVARLRPKLIKRLFPRYSSVRPSGFWLRRVVVN